MALGVSTAEYNADEVETNEELQLLIFMDFMLRFGVLRSFFLWLALDSFDMQRMTKKDGPLVLLESHHIPARKSGGSKHGSTGGGATVAPEPYNEPDTVVSRSGTSPLMVVGTGVRPRGASSGMGGAVEQVADVLSSITAAVEAIPGISGAATPQVTGQARPSDAAERGAGTGAKAERLP